MLRDANFNNSDFFTALNALNALDRCGRLSETTLETIKQLPTKKKSMSRGGDYVERMLKTLTNKK